MEFDEVALQKVREDRLLIEEVDRWLFEEIEPHVGDRVLEIGCGLGNFTRHFMDRELYVGTEPSDETTRALRAAYASYPNVAIFQADATTALFKQFCAFGVDTVFSLNVFEHIDDHMAAMQNAYHILNPGGVFILIVPAHMQLHGTLDRAIGHFRRYDIGMVQKMFSQIGFVEEKLAYINALGALGWWANSRVTRQRTPPVWQLRIFNAIVPLLKRVERRIPPPFGISLLAIGRKPQSLGAGNGVPRGFDIDTAYHTNGATLAPAHDRRVEGYTEA